MAQIESNKIIPKKFNTSLFANKEDLEKGEIADALRYSSTIKIKKSGKEIKVALVKVKAQEEAKKTALKIQLDTIKETCEHEPFENVSPYRIRQFKDCCDIKIYPYTCCWIPDIDSGSIKMSEYESKDPYEGKRPTTKEAAECNRKYNDVADKYIEACVDIAMTDMYIRNLDDKTQYELSMDQIMILGL